MTGRRIAVIGGGVSGLTAGYVLSRTDHVTLFEAGRRLGGHAGTHLVGPVSQRHAYLLRTDTHAWLPVSDCVPQPQPGREGRQIRLLRQPGQAAAAGVVGQQRHRHAERHLTPPVILDPRQQVGAQRR